MQNASAVMLMVAVTLAGCAGLDGAVDRYTARHQAADRSLAALPDMPPNTPPLAGLYGGRTTASASGVTCPPGIFSMLEVTQDGVRYNDPINGVIAGPLGLGGQIALDHAGVHLDGRLAAGRFAGTVSGGACSYRLAFRRIGPANTVAAAAPLAASPINADAAATDMAASGTATVSVAPGQPDRVAADDAGADDNGQVEVAITPASSRRYVRHPVTDTVTSEETDGESQPESHRLRSDYVGHAPLAAPKTARAPAAEADRMLAQGHIAAARPLYERAATLGDGAAATALGKTYDPLFLANMHASGMHPDPQLALVWYKRGAALGDPRASSRLSSLLAMEKQ